jgi:7-cyano-7-deazaguanine synthase
MAAADSGRATGLTIPPGIRSGTEIVLLAGGGIETAALIPEFLRLGFHVQPLHVRCGFRWEVPESACLRRLVAAHVGPALRELVEVDLPLGGVLDSHWVLGQAPVPAAGSSPELLEIPLRNVTLLAAAAIRFRDRPALILATGTTADNHFGDGSRTFFDQCETLLTIATGRPVIVLTPLIHLGKSQVIQFAGASALRDSWSCIDPYADLPCGACIKCDRRRAAFAEAGVDDPGPTGRW